MKKKPLTPKVIARWAAAHGYDYAEATRIIAAMRPESRSNVAYLYRNGQLLSDEDRMAYDSIQIRRELSKMTAEKRSHGRDVSYQPDWSKCPYQPGSKEAAAWAAEQFNKLPDDVRRSYFGQ